MAPTHHAFSGSSSSSRPGTRTPESDGAPEFVSRHNGDHDGGDLLQGARCPVTGHGGNMEVDLFPKDSVFAMNDDMLVDDRTCPFPRGFSNHGSDDRRQKSLPQQPASSKASTVSPKLRKSHQKPHGIRKSSGNDTSIRSVRRSNSVATTSAQAWRTDSVRALRADALEENEESDTNPDLSVDDQALALYKRYAHIDEGPVRQTQMFSSFLHLHFPSAEAKASLVSRRSYLLVLPDIDLSSAPVLRHAVHAVCYAHMGSNYGDERLIHESRRTYGKVLAALSRQLERNTREHDTKAIVTAIMLMTLFDDALPLPKSKGSDWMAHYQGILAYLRARGSSLFDMSVAFDRLVYMNLRMPSIFIGLARRKHMLLSEPEWLALADENFSSNPALGVLYRYALAIPGVLEKVETAIRAPFDESSLLLLSGELVNLQNEFHEWFGTISACAGKTQFEDDLLHISDPESFDMNVEEQLVMTSNTTFHSFFKFTSYRKAEDATLYWIFCLILDCSLLRILHFHPSIASLTGRNITRDIQRDAFMRATMLCRSVHFFTGHSSQGIAAYLRLLVTLSMHFFEEVGAVRELGWCQAILVASQLRYDRMLKSQPRTLCRMGDLVAPVASISRFRNLNASRG